MLKNKDFDIPRDEIDGVIHQPARLKIMIFLYVADRADFIYLMHKTGLSKGNLSSHLSKLEESGYVEVRKEFVDKIPRTLMSLTEKGRTAFEQYKNIVLTLLNSV